MLIGSPTLRAASLGILVGWRRRDLSCTSHLKISRVPCQEIVHRSSFALQQQVRNPSGRVISRHPHFRTADQPREMIASWGLLNNDLKASMYGWLVVCCMLTHEQPQSYAEPDCNSVID